MSNSETNEERMLLVLCAPSIHNSYYKQAFDSIVDFQVNYANLIIGNDNVVIVVDKHTYGSYKGKVPDDVLLVDNIEDIWMRDFSSVNPLGPVQFKYTSASMSQDLSQFVQKSFNKFADRFKLELRKSDYLLDGGNIVDSYDGKIITTTRFMEDNDLSKTEAKAILGELLGADQVAIIEPDDPVLAHSDGMLMWANESTLLVNKIEDTPALRENVLAELRNAFPGVEIVEVEYELANDGWPGFSSATGINVNSVVTFKNVYVPVFNIDLDSKFIETLQRLTDKNVVKVVAKGVSPMGGSVRCLTYQLTGQNAAKLIKAARNK